MNEVTDPPRAGSLRHADECRVRYHLVVSKTHQLGWWYS
jgi:hypothetical protein